MSEARTDLPTARASGTDEAVTPAGSLQAGPTQAGPAQTGAVRVGSVQPDMLSPSAAHTGGILSRRVGRGMLRQFELQELVQSYDPSANLDLIGKAYVFATQRHGTQLRKSGDPYCAHPIEVAGILTELRMDTDTIITALLHDTVEDTETTLEEIASLFNPNIAELVDGVTKLTKLEVHSQRTAQGENLQKFILALTRDVRVLLVKLADRLHNMRTLSALRDDKRKRIALETSEIYAPLAHRIGVTQFANELEDLAFRELYPEAHQRIAEDMARLVEGRADVISQVASGLERAVQAEGLSARVASREKRPHSIWRKLQKKSVHFEEISDLIGFRVVVPRREDCYRALGIIHRVWRFVPGRFKDYISSPKANGYRSLHTTILGPGNRRVEVQIRTERMDEVAERGVAAHWRYKNQSYGYHPDFKPGEMDPMDHLRALVEGIKEGSDPLEFLRDAKLELYQDQVFVFTPNGDLHMLPQGSTGIDFAYAVHTSVGDTMTGVQINGEVKPNRTPLENGDVVNILRSKTRKPLPHWETLAQTTRARAAIRRLIRETQRDAELQEGRQKVLSILQRAELEPTEENLTRARQTLQLKDLSDLYLAVLRQTVTGQDLLEAIVPGISAKVVLDKGRAQVDDAHAIDFVVGEGIVPGAVIHFMTCCTPVPGDRIVGIARDDREIEVHASWCETLEAHEDNTAWLNLGWTAQALESSFTTVRLRAACKNAKGVFGEVGRVVANSDGNITNVRAVNRGEDFIDLDIDVEVASLKHMYTILAALRSLSVVGAAERIAKVD
jgi:GTP diphosphokinase / guanosine-3',5'-bis(diphosphate) 3'-diphosphatase